jgi:hypothetical protein
MADWDEWDEEVEWDGWDEWDEWNEMAQIPIQVKSRLNYYSIGY